MSTHADHAAKVKLLLVLLPLLGYIREPLTTLTLTHRHPRGTRVGINPAEIWVNV